MIIFLESTKQCRSGKKRSRATYESENVSLEKEPLRRSRRLSEKNEQKMKESKSVSVDYENGENFEPKSKRRRVSVSPSN